MFEAIKKLFRRRKDYEEQIRQQDARIAALQDEIQRLNIEIMFLGMNPDADHQPCPPPPKGVDENE